MTPLQTNGHDLSEEYLSALREYLAESNELPLAHAYEIGRKALSRGLGVVQITVMHHESLATLLRRLPTLEESARAIRSAAMVEAESLSVFEMVLRGYRESHNTLTLLNQQLRQQAEELARANAGLQAANRELDQFCHAVSHDLRAPVRAIEGFSKFLHDNYSGRLDSEGAMVLDRITIATRRMAQLIDDLLLLSRVGRGELRRQPLDLAALARDIFESFRQAEPERQVVFVAGEGLRVEADEGLLRVALTNLLSNAWKFTGRQAQARIEFGSRWEGGERVFYVRDNGAGFDMAKAGKLFSVFERLHPQREFPGTGIGLATVHRIITRHGGRVWAESQAGAGATFFFTLPRAPEREELGSNA